MTNNLKSVRIERGYSLRTLAKEMDCSHNAIRTWERGMNWPHPGNAKQLKDVLGLPLEFLLAPANDEAPELSDESGSLKPSSTRRKEPRRHDDGDHPTSGNHTPKRGAYYA